MASATASTSSARASVVTALVTAATELFAARGPDAVSLREVASRAEVNYGLIHQYVGSKDDLLHLVLRHISERTAEQFADAGDVPDVLSRLLSPGGDDTYARMLAWAILQGRDPADLLGRSPALAALTARLGAPPAGTVAGDADPQAVVATMMAAIIGWRLFGRFLQSGLGLDDRPHEEVTAAVRDVALRLLERPAPSP